VDSEGASHDPRNLQNSEAVGKTSDRNLPAEILGKAADRALASYLEVLASEVVETGWAA
jgi:hypothetical protein